MSLVYAFAIAVQLGAGVYLLLSRHMMRILFGLVLLSTAANLLIFVSGGLYFTAPPVIQVGQQTLGDETANPLPQALILTAIVIGFALVSFAAALVLKAYYSLGTVLTDEQNDAEALGSPFDKEATSNG